MEKHPLHLKNPELQTSEEVEAAVEKQEHVEGEKVPNNPSDRIEAYMDRLENIFLNEDEETRKRNLEMFRDKIYDELIIKKENFPESYFELQQRIARERGQPVVEIPEDVREQMMDVAIEDQKHSLDAWIDYLTSDDAVYPAWFKYYAWNQITKLSQFDKERGEFKKRTNSTVAPYPDIYREPLAQIADIYEKVKKDNKNLKEPEIKEAFSKKFPALYAELIEKSLAAQIENREEVRGEWVKYEQGDEEAAEILFKSLEGKGTGWCTAGQATAEKQIRSGDFYVYYTNDVNGDPTQPRLAIRMNGKKQIGEIRGVLPHQGVESQMEEVLDDKLSEFGKEADIYRKKSKDMRLLTTLEHKREKGESFTKDDLLFLYEINSIIEGFGYEKDPRIDELKNKRNFREDVPIIFECKKDQIAGAPNEINENTKVYIGPLERGLFTLLPDDLQYIYHHSLEYPIKIKKFKIGGKSSEELQQMLSDEGISTSCKRIFESKNFTGLENTKEIKIVIFNKEDIEFEMTQINIIAEELGLELCPAEVAIPLIIDLKNSSSTGRFVLGMAPVIGSTNEPMIFYGDCESWGTSLSETRLNWHPGGSLVLSLPDKSK